MAQVKVKNSPTVDRDIRYEACLQVAIGHYGKFIKDGERALTVLQSTIKKPIQSHASPPASFSAVVKKMEPPAPSPDTVADKKVKTPTADNSSADVPRSKKKVKSTETTPQQSNEVTNGQKQSKVSSSGKPSCPELESRPACLTQLEPSAAENLRQDQEVNPDNLANEAVKFARNNDEASLRKAVGLFTEAIKLNSQHPGYYGNRSLCFYKLKDHSSSLNDAVLALQFDPTNVKYLRWKAFALIGLRRFNEAAETARKILEIEPGDARALEIEAEARKNMPPPPNDPSNVAILSRLPRRITAQGLRDLICGHCEASLARPVHFLIDNQPYTTGVVFLVDVEGAQRVLEKLQNYPFGLHRVRVELVKQSYAESLPLSTSQPNAQNGGDFSSDTSSDDEAAPARASEGVRPKIVRSVSSDSSSTHFYPSSSAAGSANGTPSQVVGPNVKAAATNDTSRACSVFVGNVPSDTELNEMVQFIHEGVPSIGMRFTVVKKAAWDYCFVNLQSSQDAELVQKTLHKVPFGPVILDCSLQTAPPSAVVRTSSSADNLVRGTPSPTSPACTSLYVTNLPASMSLHELLNEIYAVISPVIKSDFALYKQTQWRHCFLNFETSWAAESSLRYVNGFRLGSTILQARLTESKTVSVASTHQGYNEFVMSATVPSQWLRLDNLDGACNDNELRELFQRSIQSLLRETDFSAAYLRFADVQTATRWMRHYQGVIIRRSALAIRYAIPRK